MRKLLGCLAWAFATATFGVQAQSATDSEILQLESDAKLADAKKKKADAETALIDANRKLQEAKAQQDRAGDDAAKAAAVLRGSRKSAELDEDLTDLKKLKDLFGEAPKVGREGSITVTESSANQLLATRAGSIAATQDVAARMCASMKGKVAGAFFAPADLDAKVQRTRIFLGEIDGVWNLAQNKRSELDGIQMASVTAIVGALTAARYLVGGLDELSKVFRGDYAAVVASTTRSTLLESLVAGACPNELTTVGIESVLRLRVDTGIRDKLDYIVNFVIDHEARSIEVAQRLANVKLLIAEVTARKSELESEIKKLDDAHEIVVKEAKKNQSKPGGDEAAKSPIGDGVAAAKSPKQPPKQAEVDPGYRRKRALLEASLKDIARDLRGYIDQRAQLNDSTTKLKALDATTTKIKALLDGVKGNPAAFAEAVAWSGYDVAPQSGSALKDRPRVTYVLSAQDAQITTDRAFVGRRLDSLSTVEVVFQATTPTGDVKAGGAISVSKLREKIAFTRDEPAPVQATLP